MTVARPRRSILYMPGSNQRALDKGKSLPADGLILDLEDAVAPEAKAQARSTIKDALAQKTDYGSRELIVRVNGLDSVWGHADLATMATAGADAILLPKVDSADTVRRATAVLNDAGGPADLPIWCMIETPRGVLHAEEIADLARVGCLIMGTSDLTKDLQALHTVDRAPMLPSLGICLLAARAAGIAIVDGVYLNLADEAGHAVSCRQGRELGFDGKTLIHPKQIAAANAAFGPSQADVDDAVKIIAAFEDARAQGKGVVVVDGKLVENLHVAEARRLVQMARAIESLAGKP